MRVFGSRICITFWGRAIFRWWLAALLAVYVAVITPASYERTIDRASRNAQNAVTSPIDEQTLAALQQFPQLSDLVTASVKIPWIDAKAKDFEEAALQYEETYKDEIRKNPGQAALNSQAAEKMVKIAQEVLKQYFDLYKHPNFDINHNCCFSLEETRWTEHDLFETANMMADEHNTAKQTIQVIRVGIEAERAKYETIINHAAQK